MRAFGRLGSSVSVLDFLHLGSSLSLRGVGRFGSCIAVADRLALGNANTYMYYNGGTGDPDSDWEFYVAGARALSLTKETSYGGGNLHGLWYSDHIVHTSDKRLKRNIRPLMESLDARAAEKGASENSAQWVLRELRPVSYQFKKGPDAKFQRFGFIADDVQATIPTVIREDQRTPDRIKGILYEDLVAVLATAMQSMQHQMEGTDTEAQGTRHRLDVMEARLLRVEQAVAKQSQALKEGLKAIEAAINRRSPPALWDSPLLHTTWQGGGAHGFDTAAASRAEWIRNWTSEGRARPGYEVIV